MSGTFIKGNLSIILLQYPYITVTTLTILFRQHFLRRVQNISKKYKYADLKNGGSVVND